MNIVELLVCNFFMCYFAYWEGYFSHKRSDFEKTRRKIRRPIILAFFYISFLLLISLLISFSDNLAIRYDQIGSDQNGIIVRAFIYTFLSFWALYDLGRTKGDKIYGSGKESAWRKKYSKYIRKIVNRFVQTKRFFIFVLYSTHRVQQKRRRRH